MDRSQRGMAEDLGKVVSMKATGTDALNLIRHWKEAGAQMHCTCASEGAGFQLTGRITELSDSVLSITGTSCEALIPLDGVSYHSRVSGHSVSHQAVTPGHVRKRVGAESSQWGHGGHGRGANRLLAGGAATVGGTRGGGVATVAGRRRRRVAWYGTSWEGD